ncbi:hypothetical protein RRG08_022815 [Elysia crispata]|uniref:Uncharacterized protein n=1 Tax=Elysia crispata TaxID=231223 RepID=A0AAE1D8D1_9GAST|nr:hypothetical protein RRG08_022815 [Elysia crispata]
MEAEDQHASKPKRVHVGMKADSWTQKEQRYRPDRALSENFPPSEHTLCKQWRTYPTVRARALQTSPLAELGQAQTVFERTDVTDRMTERLSSSSSSQTLEERNKEWLNQRRQADNQPGFKPEVSPPSHQCTLSRLTTNQASTISIERHNARHCQILGL